MRPMVAEQVIAATKGLTGVAGARDKAILLLGFAGAFRQFELVALNVEDFGMREGNLIVSLRLSKTDQMADGREVVIPPSRGSRCSIKALIAWLEISQITTRAVFRRVDRNGVVLDGRLGAGIVASVVKEGASYLGLDPDGYGGHSLRAGFVTTAAKRGVPNWAIKRQTGHKTELMIDEYIRPIEDSNALRVL